MPACRRPTWLPRRTFFHKSLARSRGKAHACTFVWWLSTVKALPGGSPSQDLDGGARGAGQHHSPRVRQRSVGHMFQPFTAAALRRALLACAACATAAVFAAPAQAEPGATDIVQLGSGVSLGDGA